MNKGGQMSNYENAPATHMLAVYCAACGRPLLDAKSVETGMGPDCRRKHGYNDDVSDNARVEANGLVHKIALDQNGVEVLDATTRLREIGFVKLADRIIKRLRPIEIEETQGRLIVKTPYDYDAVTAMRAISGRRWDGELKVNTFPVTSRDPVWELLQNFFPGALGVGPKGTFTVPS